jgi:hypothetical protein
VCRVFVACAISPFTQSGASPLARNGAMTVTIELSPEIEAGLAELAKAQGLALPQYVQYVLKERISVRTSELSPAERAAAWRSSVRGLPLSPPLSDEAVSRDGIYGAHG